MKIKAWVIVNALEITFRKLIFCLHGETGREMPTQSSMQESPSYQCALQKGQKIMSAPIPPRDTPTEALPDTIWKGECDLQWEMKSLSIMSHTTI